MRSSSISEPAVTPLRLGVCGLGRGFMLMLPTLLHDPRVLLLAAAEPRRDARERFTRELGGRVYQDLDALCEDPRIEAIYLATPHELHAEQAVRVAASGKALLLEKPMALNLAEARRVCQAFAGGVCVIGPSHSFDEPYQQTARLLAGGGFGALRHILASHYTDFARRPRRPAEFAPAAGGAVFNQGAHQVDLVRLLAGGGRVLRVSAAVWPAGGMTAGAYSARIEFAGGAVATLCYDGGGHYDSAEGFDGITELGRRGHHQGPPPRRESARAFGPLGVADARRGEHHEHFGSVTVSCDGAVLRPRPDGVVVHHDGARRFYPAVAADGLRGNVIGELYTALREDAPPRRDPRWGAATVAVCEAILRSAERAAPVVPESLRES